MNVSRLLLIASLAAGATVAAHADTLDRYPSSRVQAPVVSGKTRAQVQAELFQFQQATANPWSKQYDQVSQAQRGLSRDEVRAEFLRSRAEAAALSGEDSGSAYLAQGQDRVVPTGQLAGTPHRSAE